MIGSVHVADVGRRSALGLLRKAPKPASTPGLRNANLGITKPPSAKLRDAPDFGRVALVAFWDDDAALDRFLADTPLAHTLAGGWRVRLEPLRIHGSWPGVPDDLPRARTVEHDGPAAVLTLGRFRWHRVVPFLRTSAKAEGAVVDAAGKIWATALAKPPFVSTCSLWESDDALRAYAYGGERLAHPNAIAADRANGFHHQSAFIRFRPYGSEGELAGRNPLAESWMPAPK
ncbi:MAG: spheroidene monooxygenase [Acidimicrobiia bacterium]